MKAILERIKSDDKQTLGTFKLKDDSNTPIFNCNTLELPERENKVNISRIPAGDYEVVTRESRKYGSHFLVKNVKGRNYILLHKGNYWRNTKGCILLGKEYADIDGDGYTDILNSYQTLKALVKLTSSFTMTVIDNE